MTLQKLAQYGKAFQHKVIGTLLTDKAFLLTVRDVLRDENFDSESQKWIIQHIVHYFDKYHTIPTPEVFKVELQKLENEVLEVAIKAELRNCYEATQEDSEYVKSEFLAFAKNQELKAALLASADLLNSGDYDGIRSVIDRAMKAGVDKNIGHEYKKDVESRYREDYRPTVATPWPTISDAIQGGWGPGDLIIIFGGPGSGKSWLCISTAAEAVKLGYNVNYYTLELGEEYVGKRFDANITGLDTEGLKKGRSKVEKTLKALPGNLIIKEYPPKNASINTIKAHIQKCSDMGMKPDLVIIDYVDYLKSPSKVKYLERKDEIDDVFISAKALAKEMKIPVITPSQVNRGGAKDDVIEGDKAAGSYDKIMVADICLSLSRKKEDKVLGTGRLHLMKSRYGNDGLTWDVQLDTATGTMNVLGESQAGGGTSPGGSKSYKDVASKFFSLENSK